MKSTTINKILIVLAVLALILLFRVLHLDHYLTLSYLKASREKEEDKRRGIQVGADAYIVKGDFDQNSLVDTLRSLLG